ncbi:hypothetical protein RRF57_002056 [Xylaria bambusicola]|uniref:ESCRT-II complex subunit VPS25 n=1 Tax=Xylaria bambusicola TaxID=326684 RepID=A0AAN7UI56_9PEZI
MATPAPSFTTTSSSSLGAVGRLTPTTTSNTITTALPSSSNNTFQFPRDTLHSQHSKWASLILSYCAYHKLYKLSLSSPSTEDLFHNRRIDRRLSLSDRREVLDFMRRDGRAEFIKPGNSSSSSATAAALNTLTGGDDGSEGVAGGVGGGGGDVWWVYWRTPEEWAALVEAWVDETAQKGTVLTLYELSQGEDTTGTEFHGLDLELLQKALQVLVKRNKAQIFGQEDQLGVKFF